MRADAIHHAPRSVRPVRIEMARVWNAQARLQALGCPVTEWLSALIFAVSQGASCCEFLICRIVNERRQPVMHAAEQRRLTNFARIDTGQDFLGEAAFEDVPIRPGFGCSTTMRVASSKASSMLCVISRAPDWLVFQMSRRNICSFVLSGIQRAKRLRRAAGSLVRQQAPGQCRRVGASHPTVPICAGRQHRQGRRGSGDHWRSCGAPQAARS